MPLWPEAVIAKGLRVNGSDNIQVTELLLWVSPANCGL